jgi:hypothetical protein
MKKYKTFDELKELLKLLNSTFSYYVDFNKDNVIIYTNNPYNDTSTLRTFNEIAEYMLFNSVTFYYLDNNPF